MFWSGGSVNVICRPENQKMQIIVGIENDHCWIYARMICSILFIRLDKAQPFFFSQKRGNDFGNNSCKLAVIPISHSILYQ